MKTLINIGEKIKKAMKNQKITQKELGDKIGVTRDTIQNYVVGRREPNIETMCKIAKALNISFEELILDDYKPNYKLKHEVDICKKAINTFGERNQIIKAIEECGELIAVLAQTFTKPDDVPVGDILTEIADVEIMIQQLRIIFGDNAVDQYKDKKLKKLEGVVW